MSDLALLVWFLATAVVTITILVVGTLAAAGLIPRHAQERAESRDATREG
jgi:hypothetical protein